MNYGALESLPSHWEIELQKTRDTYTYIYIFPWGGCDVAGPVPGFGRGAEVSCVPPRKQASAGILFFLIKSGRVIFHYSRLKPMPPRSLVD